MSEHFGIHHEIGKDLTKKPHGNPAQHDKQTQKEYQNDYTNQM